MPLKCLLHPSHWCQVSLGPGDLRRAACSVLFFSPWDGKGLERRGCRRFGLVWDTDYPPVSVPNLSGAEGRDNKGGGVRPLTWFSMVVILLLTINCHVRVLGDRCLHAEFFMEHCTVPTCHLGDLCLSWPTSPWLLTPGRKSHNVSAPCMPLPGRLSSWLCLQYGDSLPSWTIEMSYTLHRQKSEPAGHPMFALSNYLLSPVSKAVHQVCCLTSLPGEWKASFTCLLTSPILMNNIFDVSFLWVWEGKRPPHPIFSHWKWETCVLMQVLYLS